MLLIIIIFYLGFANISFIYDNMANRVFINFNFEKKKKSTETFMIGNDNKIL